MKNIMLSIRPEWLQKILSGQKTVELRLSKPNIAPPFKVFLYCSCKGTKNPSEILEIHSGGKIYKANGLVVGEFTCTGIDRVVRVGIWAATRRFNTVSTQSLETTPRRGNCMRTPASP